ncbi:MAG: DUF4136 domain-containing protein [Planctomycetota bacterium]
MRRVALDAVALTAAAWFAVGCSGSGEERIRDEIDRGAVSLVEAGEPVTLSSPASFDFATGSTVSLIDLRFDSFAIEADIREALEVEMGERGIVRDRGGDVDYRVGYTLLSKDTSKLTDAVRTMGLPAITGDDDRELPRGSLLLAILDAREGELVWRAAIEGAIDHSRSAKERKKRIAAAVGFLLQDVE